MIKRFIITNLFLFDLLLISPLSGQSTPPAIPVIQDSTSLSEEITSSETADTLIKETDSIAPLEKNPVLTSFVKASYPDSLLASGIEGSVTMDLLIDDSGHVDSVTLIKDLHPTLDSLAMHAASQFVFSPGTADGKPVSVYLTYEYTFTLSETIAKIEELDNFKGIVLEKGTRKPIADAFVSITIGDTVTNKHDSIKTVITAQGTLPLAKYLEKIGTFKGQSLEAGKVLTVTDSTGRFSFKSIPPGKAYIKVISGGFDLYNEEIDVHKGEVLEMKCFVERVSYNEYEITVYGKQEKKEVTRRTIQVSEAKRVPGFSGDAVKAVQALPGVARPVFGSTEIILRGADWEDNKYYIDGIEIPYLWHNVGQNAVLNSNLIENTNLYPGGFGVRYGDALGGIIDIESRKAKKDRWHCAADMNLSYSSLELEFPISKKVSFIGAMRRDYYMTLMGLIIKNATDIDLSFTAYYWDYSMRLDITPNANHSLFFQYIASKDTMYYRGSDELGGSTSDVMNYGENFKIGIAGWDWKISKDLKNTLRYGISPIDMQINMASGNSNFKGAIHGYEHTVRDELEYKLNEKIKTTLGLDLHLEPSDISYSGFGTYRTSDNYELRDTTEHHSINFVNGSVGGYLSCEIKPVENLTITPEYRLDYYPGLNYQGSLIPEFWDYKSKEDFRWSYEPSFRLSSRYTLSPKHTIKGSLGSYNKSPGYDANAPGYDAKASWGNLYLEPARGSQYSLGYEWQISDLVSLDLSGYINKQWNKAQLVYGDELNKNETERMENRGKGRMRGLEIFLRHNQSKRFFGWLSYTLAYSERYDYKERKWLVFDRNILNNIQLVSSFNLKKNKNIGLRLQYTDGYPYTPAQSSYYDASNFQYIPTFGETNSKKYDPFIGLDIRFEKKVAYKKFLMTYYVGCDRILHFLQFVKKDNGDPLYFPAEMPTYNFDYTKFEGFANYPSPTFGLSLEF